jgi:transcription antitermination factor NusG
MAEFGESWFAVHCRPRCEKKLAALLVTEKIEHYLPLVNSVRHYARQSKTHTKPLFPGYVFVHVDPDRKPRIYTQEHVARAITISDQAAFKAQLLAVRLIVGSGYTLTVMPFLAQGRMVRVMQGPLKGLEGFVNASGNPKGIVIAIDVLRQGVLVPLPLTSLKVLP